MKINFFWKIIGGILLSIGGVAAITIATIKLNTKNNDDLNQISNEENHESKETNTKDVLDKEIKSDDNTQKESINTIKSQENDEVISFIVENIENFQESHNSKNDYQCRFAKKSAFDCTISAIEIDTDLNHTNISDLEKYNSSLDESKEKHLIYKVSLNNTKEDKSKIDWTKTSFNLIKQNGAQKNIDLYILFTMNGNSIHEKTKTENFIFKAQTDKTINVSENSEFKCLIEKNKTTNNDCYVYDFEKNKTENINLHELKFEKNDDDYSTKIINNKYYLVTLNDFEISAQETKNIHIKTTENTTIHNSDVMLAFLYQYSDDNQLHLFISDK